MVRLRRAQRPRLLASDRSRLPTIALERLESRVLLSATGARISGTVFNDVNATGRQGHGDTGLAGWTVFV